MNTPEKDLEIIDNISVKVIYLLEGNQDVIVRFVYCAVQKLNKINSVIKLLYPQMNSNNEIEFSLGILVRSLFMDCIMVNYLAFIIQNDSKKTEEEVYSEVKKNCISFASDGIDKILNEINKEEGLEEVTKINFIQNIMNEFPDVVYYNSTKNHYSKKEEFCFTLKTLNNKSKSKKAEEREIIYKKYSFYSKYDHLSSYSSVIQNTNSFEYLKSRIDGSLNLLTLHLKILLFIGVNYGHKSELYENFNEINNYINMCLEKNNQ